MQPERRRLLEALSEPDSASGLARRFDLPRQRLNYHLKELERVRLLDLVEERRKGNCIERVVRATARSYVISPAALGALGGSVPEVVDRFSALHLVSLAARAVREVGGLLTRAAAAEKRVATFSIDSEIRFRTARDRAAFADDLTAAFTSLSAKYHDPKAGAGRTFRFTAFVHPRLAESATASPKEVADEAPRV
jgi:DNA-binding transcriptional ArsR family regulator